MRNMNMINYYKGKMENSHKQWDVALETDKPIAAKKHMEDYLNYKEMYENRMKECGETV